MFWDKGLADMIQARQNTDNAATLVTYETSLIHENQNKRMISSLK